MRGGGHAPSRTNFADAFTGAMGGLICIFVLLWLTNITNSPWLMASLGGSSAFLYLSSGMHLCPAPKYNWRSFYFGIYRVGHVFITRPQYIVY